MVGHRKEFLKVNFWVLAFRFADSFCGSPIQIGLLIKKLPVEKALVLKEIPSFRRWRL